MKNLPAGQTVRSSLSVFRRVVFFCFLILFAMGSPTHAASGEADSGLPLGGTIQIRPLNTQKSTILTVYQALFWEAYEKSPSIRMALARKKQKSARRYTAWARRLAPRIDLNISQEHSINALEDSSAIQSADSADRLQEEYRDGRDFSSWDISMDLPLYRRSTSLSLDIAGLEEKQAEQNLEIATHELDLTLFELLGNYLVQSYRLINLDNSISLSRDHVKKIQRGYELHDQTRLALLRAQANLQDLETRRLSARPNRQAAYRKLLDFTGLNGDEAVLVRLSNLLISEEKIAECITLLVDNNETDRDLQMLLDSTGKDSLRSYFTNHSTIHHKIILERQLARTRALTLTQDDWPSLMLKGEYGRRPDTRFEDFDGEGSVSLVFSLPLFSGGTRFSNSREEDAAREQAEINSDAQMEKTLHSIENSREIIISLRQVLANQRMLLTRQEEIVRLSKKSYQIKQTSMQDLLTGTNRLIDIKNNIMSTLVRLGIASRRFFWNLGSPLPLPDRS